MNEPAIFETPTKTMPLDTVHRIESDDFAPRNATHAEIHNVYGMQNTRGTFEGMQRLRPNVRPFVMTRASYAGGQRYAATWIGDNSSTWDHLRLCVEQLINLGLSGFSYSGCDVGGFVGGASPELLTRWYEIAAFTPVYRNHSAHDAPRMEPWVDGPEHLAIRRKFIEERYRLMPYLYSLGAATWFDDGSIMRGLVMDFPADSTARGVNDQYLLGRALLVAPVTTFGARSRSVYLPAAGWYDFYTGRFIQGGRTIEAEAPAERMPLFVRAGSIVPIGQPIEWTRAAEGAPITLLVYRGADGHFTLYNDDGVSNGYKHGDYARIPIAWDDKAGTLTIGAREGHYPGMPQQRFIVRVVSPQQGGDPLADNAPRDRVVDYSGDRLSVRPES